jgi:signal transduction histidine kinase
MDAMAETKRLAYGAFPTELERQGLCAALVQLTETIRNLHHVETRCITPKYWQPLENATELHIYRIAQESVANAVKHGKPRHVEITLNRDFKGIALTVIDDGIGFPANRDPSRISMGLDIMRHRANLIGGTFKIRSRKSGGTEVMCCIPEAFLVSRKSRK